MESLTKVCPRCKIEKSIDDYRLRLHYKTKEIIPVTYCVPCQNAKASEWYQENKERINLKNRGQQTQNPHRNYKGTPGVTKVCCRCSAEKPVAEFYSRTPTKRWKTTLRGECKECSHEENIKRPAKKKWAHKNWKLRRNFGITLEQYEELWLKQNGQCAICGRDYSHDSMGHDLAVDHCHETGEIRGLLCRHCNIGLGKLGDSVDGLMRAVEYLQNPRDNRVQNDAAKASVNDRTLPIRGEWRSL